MRFAKGFLAAVAAIVMVPAATPGLAHLAPPAGRPVAFDGTLSVLTYNVHGLPWPVAWGRPADLRRIADDLLAMRRQGCQPHVVVLQEAFTDDARAIGAEAGYRYVVDGPGPAMANPAPAGPDAVRFAQAQSWLKGEGLGKFVGSGLQILSDYPVERVRRMAFPAYACAGFDCLANKGALLATLRLPGRAEPVDVVTTHLNSRHASGVPNARSQVAYRLQTAFLADFIRTAHDRAYPLVVAGDFNVGSVPARRGSLLDDVQHAWTPGAPVADAYGVAGAAGLALSPDARFSRGRARDWQFFADGRKAAIRLAGIDVPFGHAPDGSMLSDHVGYTVRFAMPSAAAPRS